MPAFGKRTGLGEGNFAEFEIAFGADPYGRGKRKDQGENGRFRKFSRKQIGENGGSLDILWLRYLQYRRLNSVRPLRCGAQQIYRNGSIIILKVMIAKLLFPWSNFSIVCVDALSGNFISDRVEMILLLSFFNTTCGLRWKLSLRVVDGSRSACRKWQGRQGC
jgi:hypothetical protein